MLEEQKKNRNTILSGNHHDQSFMQNFLSRLARVIEKVARKPIGFLSTHDITLGERAILKETGFCAPLILAPPHRFLLLYISTLLDCGDDEESEEQSQSRSSLGKRIYLFRF